MKTRVLPNLLITACRLAGTNGIIKKENMKKLILGVFLAVCWCTGTANAQDALTNALIGLARAVNKKAPSEQSDRLYW